MEEAEAPAVAATVGEAEDSEAGTAAVASGDLAAAQVVEAAHPAAGDTHEIAFT